MKEVRSWKKVYLSDLEYIVTELKGLVNLPALIFLSGPVGAGKTTFIKKFVGGKNEVSSPTYSIINEAGNCAHADFYRIEKAEEIIHLEMSLYLEDKTYFFIEWGMPHINQVHREIGDKFYYYDLEISLNNSTDENDDQSRNFKLLELNPHV